MNAVYIDEANGDIEFDQEQKNHNPNEESQNDPFMSDRSGNQP